MIGKIAIVALLLFGLLLPNRAKNVARARGEITPTPIISPSPTIVVVPSSGASGGPSYDGYPPGNAFDGNFSTFWAGYPTGTNQSGWDLSYAYQTLKPANSTVTITFYQLSQTAGYYPKSMTFEVFTQANIWVAVGGEVTIDPTQPTYSYISPGGFSALHFHFNPGTDTPPYVREVSVASASPATPTPSPIVPSPTVTQPITPTTTPFPTPDEDEAALYSAHFDTGIDKWGTERLDGQPLIQSPSGGKSGGYVYTTGPWWPDPNHHPPGGLGYLNLIAFTHTEDITTALSTKTIDFRNAVIRASVRGEQVDLKGSHLVFWFQAWSPQIGRYVNYAYVGQPLDYALESGDWTNVTLSLTTDPNQWACLGVAEKTWLYGCAPLDSTLADVNRDFGFILFPLLGAENDVLPTGTIGLDEVSVSYHMSPRTALATLSVTPQSVQAGQSVAVSWENIPAPVPADWIGFYPVGAPPTGYIPGVWMYTSSCAKATQESYYSSGSCAFPVPVTMPAGSYELRLWADDGYNIHYATAAISVSQPVVATATPTPFFPTATPTQTLTPTPTPWQRR